MVVHTEEHVMEQVMEAEEVLTIIIELSKVMGLVGLIALVLNIALKIGFGGGSSTSNYDDDD